MRIIDHSFRAFAAVCWLAALFLAGGRAAAADTLIIHVDSAYELDNALYYLQTLHGPRGRQVRIELKDNIELIRKLTPISWPVEIEGNGFSITRSDAGLANNRIFFVQSGQVTLRNLTLRGGNITGDLGEEGNGGGGGFGGAIFVNSGATVLIEDCSFEENRAAGGSVSSMPVSSLYQTLNVALERERVESRKGQNAANLTENGGAGASGWDGEGGEDGASVAEVFQRGETGQPGYPGFWGARGGNGGDGYFQNMSLGGIYSVTDPGGLESALYWTAGAGGDGGAGGTGGKGGNGGAGGFGAGGSPGGAGGDGGKGGPGGDTGLNFLLAKTSYEFLRQTRPDLVVKGPGRNGRGGNAGAGGDAGIPGFGGGSGAAGPPGRPGRPIGPGDMTKPVGFLYHYSAPRIGSGYAPWYTESLVRAFDPPDHEGTAYEGCWRVWKRRIIVENPPPDYRFAEASILECPALENYVSLGAEQGAAAPTGGEGSAGFGGGLADSARNAASGIFCGGPGAGMGGAIFVGPSAVVTIRRSFFRQNSAVPGPAPAGVALFKSAEGMGGAIFNMGVLVLDNCTMMGNSAMDGAAVYNFQGVYDWARGLSVSGSAALRFTTIFENWLTSGRFNAGAVAGPNGGAALFRTVVAGTVGGPDVYGTFSWQTGPNEIGMNFIGRSFSVIKTSPETANIISDIDPQLAPPALNGGRTLNLMPLLGSPLLDHAGADGQAAAETDQRGKPRLFGPSLDIGAVERTGTDTPVSQAGLIDMIANTPAGGVISLETWDGQTVPIRDLVINKSITLDASMCPRGVTFDGGGSNRLVTVSGPDPDVEVTFRKIVFARGRANFGGAILVTNQASIRLLGCVVRNSSASTSGGGIHVTQGASLWCEGTTFLDNAADDHGGAALVAGEAHFEQCTLAGNRPIALRITGRVTARQSAFRGNEGSAIVGLMGARLTMSGSIFSEPGFDSVVAGLGGVLDASQGYNLYSDEPAGLAGPGNLFNTDAKMLPLNTRMSFAPILPLAMDSPARDAGDPAFTDADALDQAGRPRLRDGETPPDGAARIDIGPAEAQTRLIYVRVGAIGANTGASWTDAFADLAAAAAIARDGDEIRVAAGSYFPLSAPDNEADPAHRAGIVLAPGVILRGGYDGTEGPYDEPDAAANLTTISGFRPGSLLNVIWAQSSPGASTVIEGVTITGGRALDAASANANPEARRRAAGGGIYWSGAGQITLRRVVFDNNMACIGGGAFLEALGGGKASLQDVKFVENQAMGSAISFSGGQNGGGGLFAQGAVDLADILFEENAAQGPGGGAWLRQVSSALMQDRLAFLDNRASFGGGLYADHSTLWCRNGIFSRNVGLQGGGGVFSVGNGAKYLNCTFSRNSGESSGLAGGLQAGQLGTHPAESLAVPVTQLRNCIFWNNTSGRARLAEQQFYTETENYSASFTIFQGDDGAAPSPWHLELNNARFGSSPSQHDPQFYEDRIGDGFGVRHDLRLYAGTNAVPLSPAIDRAFSANAEGLAEDYARRPRVVRATGASVTPLDLGAYEYQAGPRLAAIYAEPRSAVDPLIWTLVFTEMPVDLGPEDFILAPEDAPSARQVRVEEDTRFGGLGWRVIFSDFTGEGSVRLALAPDASVRDPDENPWDRAGVLDETPRVVEVIPSVAIDAAGVAGTHGETVSIPVFVSGATALSANPESFLQITTEGDIAFSSALSGSLPNLTATFNGFTGSGGSFRFRIAAGLASNAHHASAASEESSAIFLARDQRITISPPSARLVCFASPVEVRYRVQYSHGGTVRLEKSHVTIHNPASGADQGFAEVKRIETASDGAQIVVLHNFSGSGLGGPVFISVNDTASADPAGGAYPAATSASFQTAPERLGERIYVNAAASGANDGTSWENAFTSLADALGAGGVEIWVAGGVYRPSSLPGDREASFCISNVALRGGFAGTETSLNERIDPFAHPTILTGDLTGDDGAVINHDPDAAGLANNAYNVATLTGAIVIMDGFVITAGNADGPRVAPSDDPHLWRDRYDKAGGLCLQSPRVMTVNINNVRIVGNRGKNGGGIFSRAFMMEMSHCVVENNRSLLHGGGINLAAQNWVILRDVSITGNAAAGSGGGLAAASGIIQVKGSKAQGNFAGQFGGGFYAASSWMDVRSTLIAGNLAGPPSGFGHGGGLFLDSDARFDGAFVTLEANRATGNGGAAYIGARSSLGMTNSVCWDNAGTFIVYFDTAAKSIVFHRSLTSASLALYPQITLVEPVFSVGGPKFVSGASPWDAPTLAGDFRLLQESPAVDAADDRFVKPEETDLAGRARSLDGNLDGTAQADAGAYETYVNSPPSPPQLSAAVVSEGEPAGTIAGALSSADLNPGDTIAFSLVSGEGDADNTLFTLSGTNLLTAAVFDYEEKSVLQVRIRATDSGGLHAESALVIQVRNASEAPPMAVDDLFHTHASGFDSSANLLDGSLSFLEADSDPDGDSLVVSAVNGNPARVGTAFLLPSGATVTVTAAGVITYNSNRAFEELKPGDPEPEESLTYTISDGNGGFSTASVTIRLQVFNDPPRPGNDRGVRIAGKPVKIHWSTLLANDMDPEGEALTVSLNPNGTPSGVTDEARSANGGQVMVLGSYIIYQPLESDAGEEDTFQYYARDSSGNRSLATVTLTARDDVFFFDLAAAPVTVYDSGSNTTSITATLYAPPSRSFVIEGRSGFGEGDPWTPLGAFASSSLGVLTVTETVPGQVTQRYYRARSE